MTPMRRDMGEMLRLAAPVIGSRLGIMAMGLTDTVVVGRYSARELGYMALGWAPTAVVLTTAVGLLSGVQVMAARRIGEGRRAEAGAVLRRGMVYALWLGLVSSALLYILGPAFLAATGIAPDLARGAGGALRIFSLSLTASLLATAASAWLEAMGRPAAATKAMWLANGLNLACDLVLVPGGLGLPALGAQGAGWSTFIARFMLTALLIRYCLQLEEGRGLLRRAPRDRPAEVEQRRIGYAAGAAFFAESGAFSAMNIIAGWVGGLAVSGWAIVLNVASLIFMVPLGLAAAASVLTARAFGADDREAMVRAGKIGFGLAAGVGLVTTLVVWPGARLIASAYSRDPTLTALAASGLVLACLFFVADALQVVGAQMLRARGDIWLSTWTQIASYALVMLPMGWALALPAGLGLAGILWAVIAASLMSAALLVLRFVWLARPERLG